jgi:hypothetical protein
MWREPFHPFYGNRIMENGIDLRITLADAQDHIAAAFDLLADRDDVPGAVIATIQAAHRAVRELRERPV